MPSHPLKSISVLAAGDAARTLEIAQVELMRPRAVRHDADSPVTFCLGGRVVAFRGDEIIRVKPVDAPGGEDRQTTVDQRGFFCFDRAPPGIYEVSMQVDGAEPTYDRRGPLVELQSDMLTLELSGNAV
jgi:hypothetical protein